MNKKTPLELTNEVEALSLERVDETNSQASSQEREIVEGNKSSAETLHHQRASMSETAHEKNHEHDTQAEKNASSSVVFNEPEMPSLSVVNERIQKLNFFNVKLDTLLEQGNISPEDYSNKKREVLKRLKPLKKMQVSLELDNELTDSGINFQQSDEFEEKTSRRAKRKVKKQIEDDGSASRLSRLAAYLIDMLILAPFISLYAWGTLMVLTFYSSAFSFGGEPVPLYIYILMSIGGMCFSWTVYVVINAYWLNKYGQSLGKRVMKIYIADIDNTEEKAEFIDILLKRVGFMMVVPLIPLIGGLVSLVDTLAIFTTNKRCLHDIVAKTKVMRIEE